MIETLTTPKEKAKGKKKAITSAQVTRDTPSTTPKPTGPRRRSGFLDQVKEMTEGERAARLKTAEIAAKEKTARAALKRKAEATAEERRLKHLEKEGERNRKHQSDMMDKQIELMRLKAMAQRGGQALGDTTSDIAWANFMPSIPSDPTGLGAPLLSQAHTGGLASGFGSDLIASTSSATLENTTWTPTFSESFEPSQHPFDFTS